MAGAPGWSGRLAKQRVPHVGELISALVSVACGPLASLTNLDSFLYPPTGLMVLTVNVLNVRPVLDMVDCFQSTCNGDEGGYELSHVLDPLLRQAPRPPARTAQDLFNGKFTVVK